jgi:hypothetical protein
MLVKFKSGLGVFGWAAYHSNIWVLRDPYHMDAMFGVHGYTAREGPVAEMQYIEALTAAEMRGRWKAWWTSPSTQYNQSSSLLSSLYPSLSLILLVPQISMADMGASEGMAQGVAVADEAMKGLAVADKAEDAGEADQFLRDFDAYCTKLHIKNIFSPSEFSTITDALNPVIEMVNAHFGVQLVLFNRGRPTDAQVEQHLRSKLLLTMAELQYLAKKDRELAKKEKKEARASEARASEARASDQQEEN